MVSELDGYIEAKDGSKNLDFASTDKNKEVFKNIQNFVMGLKIWLNAV